MKYLVSMSMTALALVVAVPAFAQAPAQAANLPGPAQQAAGQTTNYPSYNAYAAQAASLIAKEEASPGGGDARVRGRLAWRELVAKANAYRVGMPIDLGQIRAQVKHDAALN
jgi:hypothetical protein